MDYYEEKKLRDRIRELERQVTGLTNYMRIAANYKHDDLEQRIDGIQAAMLKGAEYAPRPKKGRGRNGS